MPGKASELPRFLLDAGVTSVVIEKGIRSIFSSANGTYDPGTGVIRLLSGLSPMGRLVILLHEYFHALYHDTDDRGEVDVRRDERLLLELLQIELAQDEKSIPDDGSVFVPDGKLDLYVSEDQEKWDRWCVWARQ